MDILRVHPNCLHPKYFKRRKAKLANKQDWVQATGLLRGILTDRLSLAKAAGRERREREKKKERERETAREREKRELVRRLESSWWSNTLHPMP